MGVFAVDSSDPPVIEVGNCVSKVENVEHHVRLQLDRAMAIPFPGAAYTMRARPGFDGLWHPFDCGSGKFPTGLVGTVRKLLPLATISDKRERPHTLPLNRDILGFPLRDYQFQSVTAFFATDRGALSGRGVLELAMACHPAGTKVLLYDGNTKNVEDIRIGDTLMGPDSKPRTVARTHKGNGPLVEIQPIKGEPWKANLDHVLTLVETQRKNPPLYPSQRGGKIVDISIRDWYSRSNTFRGMHKLFRVPVEFAQREMLEIDPYFLGVLLGDGCLKGTVNVTKADREIRDVVYVEAEKRNLGVREEPGHGCTTYYIHGANGGTALMRKNSLRDDLKILGLLGSDSATKFIPQKYKTASTADRLNLLAGLMDTDGHADKSDYDYITKSERLAHDVAFVSRSLGLMAFLRPCEKFDQYGHGGTYWRVNISGDTNRIPCRIGRKQTHERKQKKNHLRTGFAIEPAGHGDFYGFELSGDGRYLLGDFTVTHNSGKTITALAIAAHIPGKCVVILHRKDLLHQWREEIQKLMKVEPACIGDGAWDDRIGEPGMKFIIAMPQTIGKSLAEFRSKIMDVKLLVIDEAARMGASTWYAVAQHVPAYFRCGLTGTIPEDPVKAGRLKATTGNVLIRAGAVELAKMGFLSPCKVILHRITNPGVFGNWHTIRRQLIEDNTGRNNAITEITKGEVDNGKRVLVFFDTIRHAKIIRDMLIALEVDARLVTGQETSASRNAARSDLKTGRLSVALATQTWIEGVDLPALNTVVLAAGGKSSAYLLQRLGRALRKAPGKTEATIHDFHDTGNKYVVNHSIRRQQIIQREKFAMVTGKAYRGEPGAAPQSVVDDVEVHEPGVVEEEK